VGHMRPTEDIYDRGRVQWEAKMEKEDEAKQPTITGAPLGESLRDWLLTRREHEHEPEVLSDYERGWHDCIQAAREKL